MKFLESFWKNDLNFLQTSGYVIKLIYKFVVDNSGNLLIEKLSFTYFF